ncbi:MFS transporter [Burkholderia thailandensis]|uniref:4-hydroxybenzoate transporter n=1 Tax=Burkholderia thailandensis (strain ATCC 700388 / DSM 13276 / CCUG 48851 / CIP 106301 / E264) TaxID=271848 RepID=Q2T7C6_BURTA|nr:MFS transporter [Burkholderia thailandensis]ABC35449.1 4-hydroxybenzoate transporter [Burkholderia thailandensis E264]AHI76220.1 sugar (and other) transporter family protein [Burkholderia thailandensis 2002721723]AHI82495.1 sugar (and other) transporter family protein [Burkholderia thailandensis E444]AIC91109.1 sugar (and other) transporter family protein [Burkholderia thailandensis USAMRU Malaysia \
MTTRVDVREMLDNSRFGAHQWAIVALCAACLVMDGFDVQAMGYVAPVVIREWGTAKETLSPVFGAGLFGMLIGSLVFSALADRIGRRPVLIGATLFFSVCMIATGFAQSIPQLIGWRFAAGLGLGCIMPNAMALAGEYSPRRIRVSLMMIVSCGFTVGGVAGGLITAALIPHAGWRAVFFVGGAIPLAIGVLMCVALPESIQFLLSRDGDSARVRGQLARIVPAASLPRGATLVGAEPKGAGAPFVALFQDGRARVTLLLWLVNFANLLDMYFLSNWLPTVMRDAGYPMSTAVLAGTALWAGGVAGTLALGRIIDRIGFATVLATTFLLAIIAIAAIGHPLVLASLAAVFAAIFMTGFSIIGGQPALNALAAVYYPTPLRSTGIGWSLGFGRIGSVIGPVLGGALMHLQWSSSSLFLAAAVPACVSMAGIVAIARSGFAGAGDAIGARRAAAAGE